MAKISRQTRQKEMIAKSLEKFKGFFTAEELHNSVNKIDPSIGIATVYRFLRNFVTNRQIHSYTCNRRTIYSIRDNSHCHFICEKCGKVEHIQINSLDFIKNQIDGTICHFQIDITGLCSKCSKKEK